MGDTCDSICPVRQLDDQSGLLESGDVKDHYRRNSTTQDSQGGFRGQFGDDQLTGYGDKGGASRFYLRVRDLRELTDLIDTLIGLQETSMYTLHITDLERLDTTGIHLRREGFEIIDTLAIQFPQKTVYGLLCRRHDYDSIVEGAIMEGADVLLDIDYGRIEHDVPKKTTNPTSNKFDGIYNNGEEGFYREEEEVSTPSQKGRWPTNTVFVHAPDCKIEGTKTVKSGQKGESKGGFENTDLYGDADERTDLGGGYGDKGGKEEVDDWDCDESCRVDQLDEQSGECRSSQGGGNQHNAGIGYHGLKGQGYQSDQYHDQGGASRFYHQATDPQQLLAYLYRMTGHVIDHTRRGDGMYRAVLTDLECLDEVGIALRRSELEITDTIAIQLPEDTVYGFVCRRLDHDTLAEEAIREGAETLLDLDAGRIPASGDHKRQYQPTNEERSVYGEQDGFQPTNADGRFPTNTIFVHKKGCEIVGSKSVETGTAHQDNKIEDSTVYDGLGLDVDGKAGYADEDGQEEVDDWDCGDGCRAGQLDGQSGNLKTPGTYAGQVQGQNSIYSEDDRHGDHVVHYGYGDEGGASRFYFQAHTLEEALDYLGGLIGQLDDRSEPDDRQSIPEPPFLYTSKASRKERDQGCEDLYWKRVGNQWEPIVEQAYEALSNLRGALKKLDKMGLDPEPQGKTGWPNRLECHRDVERLADYDLGDDPDSESILDTIITGRVTEKRPIEPAKYQSAGDIPRLKQGNPHPTVKPKDLIRWLFERLTDEGETVLDPFAGSGTAGVAAIESNRHCQMVELDENGNYRRIIESRVNEAHRETMNDRLLWDPAIDLQFTVDDK